MFATSACRTRASGTFSTCTVRRNGTKMRISIIKSIVWHENNYCAVIFQRWHIVRSRWDHKGSMFHRCQTNDRLGGLRRGGLRTRPFTSRILFSLYALTQFGKCGNGNSKSYLRCWSLYHYLGHLAGAGDARGPRGGARRGGSVNLQNFTCHSRGEQNNERDATKKAHE